MGKRGARSGGGEYKTYEKQTTFVTHTTKMMDAAAEVVKLRDLELF